MVPRCLTPNASPGHRPPLDAHDLAVRLETEGVNDSAAAEHGFRDTWAMAQACYPGLAARRVFDVAPGAASPRGAYFKGISFALPLLFSCIAILYWNFSLWGGDLPRDPAAAVALGAVAAFVASGGFVQVVARRGLWYAGTGQYRMCEKASWEWFRHGVVSTGVFTAAGGAVIAYFNWLPPGVQGLAMLFCLSLSLLLLSTGVLYMAGANLTVGAAVLAGIGIVAVLHLAGGVDLIAAQVVGILAASAVAGGSAWWLLRRQSRKDLGGLRSEPPGKTLYFVWPYFLYGCLYYLFLFSDRLLAWTAPSPVSALPLQFRGDYETAEDVALFAFIVLVGWVHSATSRFFRALKNEQAQCPAGRSAGFNDAMRRYYWRKAVVFALFSTVPLVAVYFAGDAAGLFATPISRKVAIWSLAGFPPLVFGLWNVSLLFALSRPLCVLGAIGVALPVNVSIGYLLSRLGSYDQAVAGFTAGAIVFAVISTRHALATIRELDYYYFASAG